jgi:hypothetical protein
MVFAECNLTKEKLDQGHLHTIEQPGDSAVGCEHSSKELFGQQINCYSIYLHEFAKVIYLRLLRPSTASYSCVHLCLGAYT